MPNIKSAKKRVKVTIVKSARNKSDVTDLKTSIKKANAAVVNKADNKQEAVKCAVRKIDQACSKGVLHKNAAARKKAQLMAGLNRA